MKKIMKNISYATYLILATVLVTGCSKSKDFVIDGKKVTIEPYGWFDLEAKHDSIVYKINTKNIILDVIFVETIIVPIVLTGTQMYEPVRKK